MSNDHIPVHQYAVLQRLSKAIADSGKWSPCEGMAVTYGGKRWRMYNVDVAEPYYKQWVSEYGELSASGPHFGPWATGAPHNAGLLKAIAEGPDLTDAATVFALLADLPEHELRRARTSNSDAVEWSARDRVGAGNWCATRAETIARAWLAAHDVEVPQ